MTWLSFADYTAARGVSRSTLERAVRDQTIATILDEDGKRLLWASDPDGHALALRSILEELAQLRAEVNAMRTSRYAFNSAVESAARDIRSQAATAAVGTRDNDAQDELVPRAPAREADELVGAPDYDAIIALARSSGIRDRTLERQAQLPQAFMAKAKQGKRRTRKSLAAWNRIAAVLGAQN